jgi:hypothetical protein
LEGEIALRESHFFFVDRFESKPLARRFVRNASGHFAKRPAVLEIRHRKFASAGAQGYG